MNKTHKEKIIERLETRGFSEYKRKLSLCDLSKCNIQGMVNRTGFQVWYENGAKIETNIFYNLEEALDAFFKTKKKVDRSYE
jgi:hypothetical protein|tara:strand:+ start:2491 stop:2736 length:246 start_codon:yes stop_codon:yes gene_type:complete